MLKKLARISLSITLVFIFLFFLVGPYVSLSGGTFLDFPAAEASQMRPGFQDDAVAGEWSNTALGVDVLENKYTTVLMIAQAAASAPEPKDRLDEVVKVDTNSWFIALSILLVLGIITLLVRKWTKE